MDNLIDDAKIEIMHRMDDQTLSRYCSTSRQAEFLCNLTTLWLPRINSVPGLSLLLPYLSHYKNLRDFYSHIRNDTQYVLMTYKDTKWNILVVANEITTVYDVLIRIIGARLGIEDQSPEVILQAIKEVEAQDVDAFNTYAIMIRFNDVIDHDTLNNYIIYSNKQELPNYFNPQILQYPVLADRDIYAVVESKTNEISENFTYLLEREAPSYAKIAITDTDIIPRHIIAPKYKIPSYAYATYFTFINYDLPSVRRAHSMKQDIIIHFNERKHPEIDPHKLTWMQYGYILHPNENVGDGILLVNLGAIGMEPATYVLAVTKIEIYTNCDYPAISLFIRLVLTPDEHQQSLIESLREIVTSGSTKLYKFEDISRVIKSIYEEE